MGYRNILDFRPGLACVHFWNVTRIYPEGFTGNKEPSLCHFLVLQSNTLIRIEYKENVLKGFFQYPHIRNLFSFGIIALTTAAIAKIQLDN